MRLRGKRNKTILLLDDEEWELTTAQQILQREGYTVLAAGSYKEALTLFEEHWRTVDMLLADISLPDGNGCELSLALQEKRRNLRVLFVSGHVGAEVCRYYGLDVTDLHFLRKPFEAAQLISSVQRVFAAAVRFPPILSKTRTA